MRHHRLPLSSAHPISIPLSAIIHRCISNCPSASAHRIAKILDLLSGAESARSNNISYPLQPRRLARCSSSLSVCASTYALCCPLCPFHDIPSIAPLTSWYARRASYSILAYSTSRPKTFASPRHGSVLADSVSPVLPLSACSRLPPTSTCPCCCNISALGLVPKCSAWITPSSPSTKILLLSPC